MIKPVVRVARREDIESFSPMKNKPTMHAWVGEVDGKIVAMGGFVFFNGRWIAFMDLTEEARKYKVSIHRYAKMGLRWARERGIKFIYADADLTEKNAPAWLTRLGFKIDPRTQYLYRWKGNE